MISKLRFSLIAVIMLVLLGFGFQNQAKGQIGLDGLFCPAVPNTTGWLETEIVGSGLIVPDFTGALIGTVESVGGDNVGGLDWHHVDFTSFYTPTPTNETGSQLVSWWTQKDGRNTYLQVTNSDGPITVHVRIHNEDCLEIRDFCDTYTSYDTHEYNFGDLFSNGGADIADANLQNVEGWVVVTAVEDCGSDNEQAYDHNYLSGQLIVHDDDDYLYGVNTYARQAVCFDEIDTITVNRVFDGSFQFEGLGWNEELPRTFIIQGSEISPEAPTPANHYDSPFMGFVVSSDDDDNGSNSTYDGGSFPNLADANLIEAGGLEAEVAILESDLFNVPVPPPGTDNTLSYNLQFYTGEDAIATCANYAAVLLIQDNGGGNGTVVDATCYQQDGNVGPGVIDSQVQQNKPCVQLADTDDDIAFGPFEFDGRTGFQIGETLSRNFNTGNFRIQVVTGLANGNNVLCDIQDLFTDQDTAALVNNFELLGDEEIEFNCDGELTGAFNAFLDVVRPDTLSAQFNLLPGSAGAGADVVHINFADSYGPPYRPIAAFSAVSVSIFDDVEVDQSCGDALVCFVRLGIDDALVMSENFNPATPTPTPTVTPSITPTPTPTITPITPTPSGNGGSSSCSIAASPVQLGTALANVLIPLVPVAFAFGVRAVRRRKK